MPQMPKWSKMCINTFQSPHTRRLSTPSAWLSKSHWSPSSIMTFTRPMKPKRFITNMVLAYCNHFIKVWYNHEPNTVAWWDGGHQTVLSNRKREPSGQPIASDCHGLAVGSQKIFLASLCLKPLCFALSSAHLLCQAIFCWSYLAIKGSSDNIYRSWALIWHLVGKGRYWHQRSWAFPWWCNRYALPLNWWINALIWPRQCH